MRYASSMMCYYILLANMCLCSHLMSQKDVQKSSAQYRDPVQVIVSGNHPDAVGNGATIIYDNRRGIDLRSFERPIKTIIPVLDTLSDTQQPESHDNLIHTQNYNRPLPGTKDDIQGKVAGEEPQLSILLENVFQPPKDKKSKYTGTAAQNIFLMQALGIKPGWEIGAKWSDGSKVDGYSLVDWIRYGMGEPEGISKIATIENRMILYELYFHSGKEK